MKKILIAAALALSIAGTANAASAEPFRGPMHGPVLHREAGRYVPGHWVRGERFVPGYARFVMVDDWRHFGLPRPAWGAHWIRVGGEFLLISNATGRIVDVVPAYY